MEIFAVMHPGLALLAMLGILALILVGMLASGLIKIRIEKQERDEKDDEAMLQEIKELDDSTWNNRLLKRLARMYERGLEKEKMKKNLKEGKGKEENGKN